MEKACLSNYPNIGTLGEDLVARWLQAQGWTILHRQWRCRWGEIDLIGQQCLSERESTRGTSAPSPCLTFVEVKTRSRGNWDADGLLAITPHKQEKLWQAARWFLADYPECAELPCRFDVALVSCQRLPQKVQKQTKERPSLPSNIDFSSLTDREVLHFPPVVLGQAISIEGYRLVLQDYIQSAFDRN